MQYCIGYRLSTKNGEWRIMKKHGLTVLELIIVIFIIGVLIAILLPAFSRGRHHHRPPSFQNNLKQWGLVFKMYANESTDNKYPHLQIDYSVAYNENAEGQTLYSKGGPDAFQIYPEYNQDVTTGHCPEDLNLLLTPEYITYPVNNTESKNGHSWCNDLEVCETDTIQFTRKRMTGASFGYVYTCPNSFAPTG
jgi:prepilin-type N-terminal cleavage/methylation domain-containing protein